MCKKLHHAILIIILYIGRLPAIDCYSRGIIGSREAVYTQQHPVADAIIHYPPSPLDPRGGGITDLELGHVVYNIYICIFIYRNCPAVPSIFISVVYFIFSPIFVSRRFVSPLGHSKRVCGNYCCRRFK